MEPSLAGYPEAEAPHTNNVVKVGGYVVAFEGRSLSGELKPKKERGRVPNGRHRCMQRIRLPPPPPFHLRF